MSPGQNKPGSLCLSEIPPFDRLESAQIHQLIDHARPLRAERGEILLQADDTPGNILVVLDGEVHCLLPSPSGSEKLIRIVGPGDSFAEEAALLARPALAMAIAARSTSLLSIPVLLVHEAIQHEPAFAEAMNLRLAAASYQMMVHIQLCIQLSSTQRVAQYLVQLAPRGAEHAEIRLLADKQTIAAQLNLTPETFSRVLSRFVREGLVHPRGRRGMLLERISELRRAAAQD